MSPSSPSSHSQLSAWSPRLTKRVSSSLVDHRAAVVDDRLEQLTLRTGAAHGQDEPSRLAALHATQPGCTVDLDVVHQLVVDVLADELDGVGRRRIEQPVLLVELVHDAEAVVARRRLHRMGGTLGELEGHRPVVEHHVDNVGHPTGNRTHAVPHVGGEDRHLRRQRPMQWAE